MTRLRDLILGALLGLVPLTAPARAQCPQPDYLDGGPCCAPAQLSLPSLPAFKLETLDVCWKDCDVEHIDVLRAEWSSPYAGGPAPCGPLRARLRLRNTAGVVAWRGVMVFTYSRTWLETTSTGTDRQVWRFLVNGDLRPRPAAGGIPCPVPPCAPAHNKLVRFTGYVDYALDCATGMWEYATMLTHGCDKVDHQPGFPRGGAFHPERSYTFVGPAATFAVGAVQPSEGGGSGFEAMRRITTGFATCTFEEQCQHGLTPVSKFCLCGPANATAQFFQGDLGVFGSCGSFAVSGGAWVPGYFSMGIGRFTDPNQYPGVEVVRWNFGGYQYQDGCAGVVNDEVFYGVSTLGGDPARQMLVTGPGGALPPTFIDQANSTRNGALALNVPFRSTHVLNLNH